MNLLFSIKSKLHYGSISQSIYLLFALMCSFVMAMTWAFVAIRSEMEFGIAVFFVGAVHGFIAWFLMPPQRKFKLILYSFIFSLLTFFLARFLFYIHFLHWQSSFVFDKSMFDFSMLVQYMALLNKETLAFFWIEFTARFNLYDVLWILVLLLGAFEYRIWEKAEETYKRNEEFKEKPERFMIKRRFGH